MQEIFSQSVFSRAYTSTGSCLWFAANLGHAMRTWCLEEERNRLEKALKRCSHDFSAAYMAVQNLHSFIQTNPQTIRTESVSALKTVLEGDAHASQTLAFFLYREAADALAFVLVRTTDKWLAGQAFSALQAVVAAASGYQQRAAAESLGSLPVRIHGHQTCEGPMPSIPNVTWEDIIAQSGLSICHTPTLIGRSIVFDIENENSILVIKMAYAEGSVQSLFREALWMESLSSGGFYFPIRFEIPMPIKFEGSFVFQLQNPPVERLEETVLHPDGYAIGFIVHKDYFFYPNDHKRNRLTRRDFKKILFRNAWLLGRLAAMGIIHSAPIPLFHNRIQQHRRIDHGFYEWSRGGRLDRWLYSCRYPNFGMTGIRDFEHLVNISASEKRLYQHIGTHILSLLLVAGSYFRNKDAERYGFDPQGTPVDVRDLFDKRFFQNLIKGIFLKYYHGFVGKAFQGEMPVNLDVLTSRMIEEMGVDRHMEEILRALDQMEMTNQEFREVLQNKGFMPSGGECLEKGGKDITIHTGPHLGGFNERISVPELTAFLSTTSAFCIAGKYWQEKGGSVIHHHLRIRSVQENFRWIKSG